MLASKITRIGIVAPREYCHVLGLTNVRLSFKKSFPTAEIFNLEEADLRSMARLESCSLIVLPPSFYGEDTPYKHYLKDRAAENLTQYAQFGRIAAFCSGTYAILKNFSYIFNNGQQEQYDGYVPLINMEGYGPIHGFSGTDLRIMQVFTEASGQKNPINLCYDGGPAIKMDPLRENPNVRPLAFFQDGNVSILAQRTTVNGILVAFSSLADIRAADVPQTEKYAEIHRALHQTRDAHDALWTNAMAILETRDLHC